MADERIFSHPDHNSNLSRREVLRVGGLVGCGLTLDNLLQWSAAVRERKPNLVRRVAEYLRGGAKMNDDSVQHL